MLNKNISAMADCIDNFFDPREKSRAKGNIPIAIKRKYLLYYLQANWEKICGLDLCKLCWVVNITGNRIDNNIIHINTCSSQLANELFMMQPIFIRKINDFLAGKVLVKSLVFHAGRDYQPPEIFRRNEISTENIVPWKKRLVKLCPLCSAHITEEEEYCLVCTRKKKMDLIKKLKELLRVEPWLTLEEVQKYYSCEEYLYNEVTSILKNYYFERIRLDQANEQDKMIAVMLLTQKSPDEINENIYNNSLTFLRGKKNVSSSRS